MAWELVPLLNQLHSLVVVLFLFLCFDDLIDMKFPIDTTADHKVSLDWFKCACRKSTICNLNLLMKQSSLFGVPQSEV